MDRIYLEDEVVSFGNYLLSKERSENTSIENQNIVTHADLENQKTLNPEVEYPEIPKELQNTDWMKDKI